MVSAVDFGALLTFLSPSLTSTSNTLLGMLLSEEGVIEASDGSKHKSSGDLLFSSVLSNPSIVFLFCLTIVCSSMQKYKKMSALENSYSWSLNMFLSVGYIFLKRDLFFLKRYLYDLFDESLNILLISTTLETFHALISFLKDEPLNIQFILLTFETFQE